MRRLGAMAMAAAVVLFVVADASACGRRGGGRGGRHGGGCGSCGQGSCGSCGYGGGCYSGGCCPASGGCDSCAPIGHERAPASVRSARSIDYEGLEWLAWKSHDGWRLVIKGKTVGYLDRKTGTFKPAGKDTSEDKSPPEPE